MASRAKLITDNLVSAFNGESITYNDVAHTITAERERLVRVINGRYPFVEISGPITEVINRAHAVNRCKLSYLVEFIELIPDDYNPDDESVAPITEVLGSVAGDIEKLAMADNNRGGLAVKTEWNGDCYYMDVIDGSPVFGILVNIEVDAFINRSDPSLGGG